MNYFKTRLNIKMAKSHSHSLYDSLLLSWTIELKHMKIYWALLGVLR